MAMEQLLMVFVCTGVHGWPVAALDLPHPEGLDKFKLFGQFLVEGKVCVCECVVYIVCVEIEELVVCGAVCHTLLCVCVCVQVFKSLKRFQSELLCTPVSMTKSWGK